jgi:hypothetical protein
MNPQQKNLLNYVLFSTVSLYSLTVNATNGYFAHGYGARSKAMARICSLPYGSSSVLRVLFQLSDREEHSTLG